MSKKRASISLSTAEAEYNVAGSYCPQLFWMKTLLGNYGFSQDIMIINCNNTSAINISKNPVQHSQTKHIDIRHHFLRDLVESEVVSLSFIPIENQLASFCVWTKTLLCKDAVIRDSTIQSEEVLQSQKIYSSLSAI
jgi:hypothetical protein